VVSASRLYPQLNTLALALFLPSLKGELIQQRVDEVDCCCSPADLISAGDAHSFLQIRKSAPNQGWMAMSEWSGGQKKSFA
jgi:hypothetical protein